MILYRPIGLAELKLVANAGWREWPPRLPHQPIFYPVLSLDYARKIARDWNCTDELSGFVGFVARFAVDDGFVRRYPTQDAGGRSHEELWIPAEELAEFNRHIIGLIEVLESYAGPKFPGVLDPVTHLPVELNPGAK